jgi:Ca-activated chloride channel family protein
MSKHGSISPGLIQASAGATGVLFLAAATGLVDVAGLIPLRAATAEPTVVEASFVEPTVVVAPTTLPPAPIDPRSQAVGSTGPVRVTSTLSQSQVLRGSDGQLYLHCGLEASDEGGRDVRRPIDLALVVDTSGSMAAAMPLLKRATLGIVERLRPQDRLTIVSYSTDAQVVFQSGADGLNAVAQNTLEHAVAGLVPEGGTNLSAGLMQASEALGLDDDRGERSNLARRILVLSDGKANQGVTEPAALARIVDRLREGGVALSSLGLGLAYDANLLTTLADAGGGAYHYAANAEALSPVYAAEIDALQTVVAFDAQLTLTLPEGVRVAQVYSWPSQQADGKVIVRLGDMSAGRSLKVVARLEVDAEAEVELRDVVDVSLMHWVPARCGADSAGVVLETLQVGLTDDAALASGSVRAEVAGDLEAVLVSQKVSEARDQVAQGNADEARRILRSVQEVTGKDSVSFEAADGTRYDLDVEELADQVAEGESSERGRAALKMTSVLERAAAR